ncbi:MAG: hypothetical protein VW475_01885 [Curvibacter sp.]
MKKSLIGLALACTVVAAQADAPRVRLFGSVGYGFGGDALVSGNWTDGTPWDLKAGQGTVLALGGDLRLTDSFSIQGSAGYHRNSVDGTNGNVVFTRVPVELLGFYALTDQVRLGLGARKSQSAKVQGGGVAASVSEPYESTAGAVAEVQYLFSAPSRSERSPLFGVYLRYVKESFKAKSASWDDQKRDGSHMALGLMFYY